MSTHATRLEIHVAGTPEAQDRRTCERKRRDGTTFAGTYLLKSTREWRRSVLWAARRTPGFPDEPWDGPVRVSIEAFFDRTKELLRPRCPDRPIRKNSKPDADNLVKAILDALTPPRLKRGITNEQIRAASRRGYLWIDDGQVHLGPVDRWYAARGCGPGVIVTVERIREGE